MAAMAVLLRLPVHQTGDHYAIDIFGFFTASFTIPLSVSTRKKDKDKTNV